MFRTLPSPVFALIIGIDNYKSGSIWNLHSCVDDAQRVRRWLLTDLDVPKDQIRMLSDSQATKENIEETFMAHLVHNPSIQRDDAIVIYFAGHGSRIPAPRDWYRGVRKPRNVEVLCTYDFDSKDKHGRVAGISDRSMSAMLRELAEAKGDNITLVLDCCFSPTQTAENLRERSRTRWTPPIRTKSEDLNRGLWPGARASPQHSQFGFLEPFPTSHLVVAACSPGHIAVEGKDGGRFTSCFLTACASLILHHTTYDQLLTCMNRQAGLDGQLAVCLGKHKNRVIFNDLPFIVDPQFVSISSERSRDLRVEAGAIHGVAEGSEFTLHGHNYRCSKNPAFAVAVVVHTHSTWSLARLKTEDVKLPRACWGRITRWNNQNAFRVKLKTSVTCLTRGWKLKKELPMETTRRLRSTGINVQRVKSMTDADISLTLYRTKITVDRHNSVVGQLGERVVRIQEPNPIKVINDAARFNIHLQSNNLRKPLDGFTRVEVYSIDADTLTKVGGNLLRNDKAVIHCHHNPILPVMLWSTSRYDLWPYLVSRYANTYSSGMIYPHPNEEDQSSPLPAGGILGIAATWPESESDKMRPSLQKFGGFLKVYFCSTLVRLNMFGQTTDMPTPSFMFPLYSTPGVLDCTQAYSSGPTIPHIWDSTSYHVSFVRDLKRS